MGNVEAKAPVQSSPAVMKPHLVDILIHHPLFEVLGCVLRVYLVTEGLDQVFRYLSALLTLP